MSVLVSNYRQRVKEHGNSGIVDSSVESEKGSKTNQRLCVDNGRGQNHSHGSRRKTSDNDSSESKVAVVAMTAPE